MSDTPDPTDDAASGTDGRRFPRWLKWGLFGALAVLVLGYGAIFLYAKVLNDSPDELDSDDLAAALADEPDVSEPDVSEPDVSEPDVSEPDVSEPDVSEPDVSEPDATPAPIGTTGADTAPGSTAPADDGSATTAAPATTDPAAEGASTWTVTGASELGYRVKEILFGVDAEGVGRTNQIAGDLVIDGTQVTAAQFVVDVASIESDDGRRDSQFRGSIMSTDEFPEAIFVLTEPIELGTEPTEGASVSTTATGDLTLRGVTNPVTFDVEAQLQNGRIGVLGNIPVEFADYGIDNPSTAGITTEDNGLLEFVLVFEQ